MTRISRRTVVRTGVKLAYAAPLVAASFEVAPLTALAAQESAISGGPGGPAISNVTSQAPETVEIRGANLEGATVRFDSDGGQIVGSALDGTVFVNTASHIAASVAAGTVIYATSVETVDGEATLNHGALVVASPAEEVTDAPPTEEAPTTDAPTTDAPTTDDPSTDEPGTGEPGTEAPPTDAPPTDAPPTDEPPAQLGDPVLHLSSAEGVPGAPFVVAGANFTTGPVSVFWDNSILGNTEAGSDFQFRLETTVPADSAPGAHQITAQDAQGRAATLAYSVLVADAPPTDAPPTDAPPTEPPPTEAPPTEAPPTEPPPTEAPPTEALPTEAPPTEAPPTETPPTEAPPTEASLSEEGRGERVPGQDDASNVVDQQAASPEPEPTPDPYQQFLAAQEVVQLNKDKVRPGANLVVSGSGFVPGALSILWDGAIVLNSATNDAGAFELSITVPDGAGPGNHEVGAIDTAQQYASRFIEVVQPPPAEQQPDPAQQVQQEAATQTQVEADQAAQQQAQQQQQALLEAPVTTQMSAKKGPPGAPIWLEGSGFLPGEVAITWDSAVPLAVAGVGNGGNYGVQIQIPVDAGRGMHTINVWQASSGKGITKEFKVVG